MLDRELLLEIGCEELPASWLPGLTHQIGEVVLAQLRAHRLAPESPAETYSTPRRLTVRIARLAERQTDLEDLVNGPPVSASFGADGSPTPAASGFASKQGVDVAALERVETPKGTYLAYRKKQRGKAAVDVLPDVLGGTLRGLTFPKLMHWDAHARGRPGRAAVRPADPLDSVRLWRPRRAVHDRPFRGGPDESGAGGHFWRGDLRTPLPDDERARGAGHQGPDASTNTARGCSRTS